MKRHKSQAHGIEITEKQHFVPKFYLKRFADPQGFLSVLDVKEERLCSRRPYPSICYSSFFYATETGSNDEASQEVEKWLGRIEDWVAKGTTIVIEKIVSQQQLTDSDRYVLAVLFSMLWIRGPRMRRQINRLQSDMRKGIMRLTAGHAVNEYLGQTDIHWTEEQKRDTARFFEDGEYELKFDNTQHLMFMVDSLWLGGAGFANLFCAQEWRIYIARGNRRFITSDSPVIEWSLPKQGFGGTAFFEHNHYLALTPEVLLELTPRMATKKLRRTSLFADKDDVVTMYNILIADHVHEFAYARDEDTFPEILRALGEPSEAGRLYVDKFGRHRTEPGGTS